MIALFACTRVERRLPDNHSSPKDAPVAPAPSTGSVPGFDAASVAVLRKAAESTDYGTRMIAIEAVSAIGSDAFVGWLEHALGDPEHDIRLAAVDGLMRLGTARARRVLVTVRDDDAESLDIRALAASALLLPQPARSAR